MNYYDYIITGFNELNEIVLKTNNLHFISLKNARRTARREMKLINDMAFVNIERFNKVNGEISFVERMGKGK